MKRKTQKKEEHNAYPNRILKSLDKPIAHFHCAECLLTRLPEKILDIHDLTLI
jgi:hypothetical protein